jgi:hypothetical protein
MSQFDSDDIKVISELLVRSASNDSAEAALGGMQLAKAIELPLNAGLLAGDILDNIYEVDQLQPGVVPEYPLDLLNPGNERDFVAYTIPRHGAIPQRTVEGDYLTITTYSIGNAIDWLLKYARDARWNIVGRCLEVFEAGFVKKMNDDGWQTLLSAGVDRNIVVYDGDAQAGQFTKRLVSLMQTVMRRNGGGNSTSMGRAMLTDMYMSPENMEDIRNWGVDQVDEITRREIFTADGKITRIYRTNLHDLDELGETQEYQVFFTNTLAASLASGDVELVVGLDLNRRDSFIMPLREKMQVFDDPTLHRQQKAGVYGWAEMGFASLSNRRVILGSN